MKSVRRGARGLWRVGFEKYRKVLSLEWKNDGVMDDKSGRDDVVVLVILKDTVHEAVIMALPL